MPTKSVNRNSFSSRASDFVDRARNEATPARLVAAGTLAAGATAYAVLRDPARRERMRDGAQSFIDRGLNWWRDGELRQTPAAEPISAA